MLKQAVVIAAAAAKKRAVLSKKANATVPNLSSKRSHQEVEPIREASRPPKRVKKLVQKGDQEIHVISSQSTEATNPETPLPTPSAQDLLEQRPRLTIPASQASSVPEPVEQVAASTIPELVDPPAGSPGGEPATPVQPAMPVLEVVVERQLPRQPK